MLQVPITTERLVIRRFQAGDLDAYLRFMLDPASTRYLAFEPEQTTPAGARALFEFVIAAYDSQDPIHAYAIADATDDSYVGSCGLAAYDDDIVEGYYCVNSEFRGQGYAVEATRGLLAAVSPDLEVRAYCHPDNTAAHAVARRSGMSPAGMGRHRHSQLEGLMFVLPPRAAREDHGV